MALYTKIRGANEDDPKIPVLTLSAAIHGYFSGRITQATAVSRVENLSLAEDGVELAAIKTVYDGKANNTLKLDYLVWLERVFIQLEAGVITETEAKVLLEVPV